MNLIFEQQIDGSLIVYIQIKLFKTFQDFLKAQNSRNIIIVDAKSYCKVRKQTHPNRCTT